MSDGELQRVRIDFWPTADTVPWQVSGMMLSEGLNRPYRLRLRLLTTDLSAEPADLLGTAVTVTVERGEQCRDLCGIIHTVEDGIVEHDDMLTTVTVVPALMALDQRKTSRIFQELTVPEILQTVLEEGLGPYERSIDQGFLAGDYPVEEYTVQYRETDLAFVERLMEENGIGYYFKHGDAETLVLFDSDAAYADLNSFGNSAGVLPMVLRDGSPGMHENIHDFRRGSQLRPTVARTMVFDWLAPGSLQEAENSEAAQVSSANGATLQPERESYEHEEPTTLYGYRSEGLDFSAVEQQTLLRRQLQQRDAIRCRGTSTATLLAPGVKFELVGHPQRDLDGPYVVVSVEHAAGSLASGDEVPGEGYVNRFECLPVAVPWRPDRHRPRPRIPGIQTAMVVGPAGEEIHTDEHGRIKVQFNWDRDGQSDDTSSCFIRVIQALSGNGWGFVFLPRIGMEVVVSFIDGDADRPVVTGCMYNGSNPTPYPLPDEKTKSTIKSNSSPGGGGFNELRFEDAAGAEEIYIHAQKDFNEHVLNDHNTTVDNDQTNTVHNNQTEEVDVDQQMTVGGNRTVHVKGDFDETVDGTETRTVTGDVTETFAANETRDISADQTETIGGSVTQTVTGSVTNTVSGSHTDTITGSLSQTITGGVSVTTPATYDVTAAGGITMTAAAGMKVIAPGGFTVLAPGGTKTVDENFSKWGGGTLDAFSWAINICPARVTLTPGIAVSATGVNMAITGLSLIHKGAAEIVYTPVSFESRSAKLKSGMIGLYMYATTLIG